MQPTTKRRLAWLAAIVVVTQLLSACCVYPVSGRGGHYDNRR